MRLPIRARLTLVFAGLMAVVLGATGTLVFMRFRTDLDSAIDAGLREQARTIGEALNRPGLELGIERVLIAPTKPFAQLYSPGGALLESRGVLGDVPLISPRTAALSRAPRLLERRIPTTEGEVLARLYIARAPQGTVVLVGDSLEARESAVHSLGLLLALGGPVALAITTAIAWLLASAALDPVERMRAEAAAITASEADRRLTVPDTGDEVSRLGATLNDMLDRLERALERERRFVDDASHELRTPLGTLRMELELALRRARTREELVAALRSASEESERLSRLAQDLLVLARVDHGRLPVRRDTVDLVALTRDVADAFASRAEQRGVRIERALPAGAVADLDPDRVRQALDNLVDNALRHTPSDGTLSIAVDRSPSATTITVADSGPGFPEEFLARVFEPFARPDGARSRDGGGTGLGLAIVRAVAEAHGGTASAENGPHGGAVVRLVLPA